MPGLADASGKDQSTYHSRFKYMLPRNSLSLYYKSVFSTP